MRNPLNHYRRFPFPVNILHPVSHGGHNARGYPVTCDLFYFFFFRFFFFFLVDASTIARTRRRRTRADPARCHPIERSRRTELNAPRRRSPLERDRTVTSPIGALDSSFSTLRSGLASIISVTRDTFGESSEPLSNFPESVAHSANSELTDTILPEFPIAALRSKIK